MITIVPLSSSTSAIRDDSFTVTLIFLSLALPCIAFAWDGLVRRQMLLPAFPVGAALGQPAARIRRIGAVAVGVFCLLASGFLLLLAWGTWLVAAKRHCQGQGAFACAGTLVGSAEGFAWAWFGLFVFWFVIVWLRMGDARKRVLVYGVWYHQEKVARQINQRLRAQQLAPLPREQMYVLEEAVVRLMRLRGWLVYGEAWLDGGRQRTAQIASPDTMRDDALQTLAHEGMGNSERAAIELLLTYFLEQAQRAEHMSPLRRWWVGTGQRGKLGVYGRRGL